jgi:hypothetical protein
MDHLRGHGCPSSIAPRATVGASSRSWLAVNVSGALWLFMSTAAVGGRADPWGERASQAVLRIIRSRRRPTRDLADARYRRDRRHRRRRVLDVLPTGVRASHPDGRVHRPRPGARRGHRAGRLRPAAPELGQDLGLRAPGSMGPAGRHPPGDAPGAARPPVGPGPARRPPADAAWPRATPTCSTPFSGSRACSAPP